MAKNASPRLPTVASKRRVLTLVLGCFMACHGTSVRESAGAQSNPPIELRATWISGQLQAVKCVRGGCCVAVGSHSVAAYSGDSQSWTQPKPIASDKRDLVAIDGERGGPWVAVGDGIVYSNDGQHWLPARGAHLDLGTFFAVARSVDGQRWVAAGDELIYSDDGMNWEHATDLGESGATFAAVACGKTGRWVAVGDAIIYSDDGRKWVRAKGLENPLGVDFAALATATPGRWVAVGGGGRIAYSDDGANWEPATVSNSMAADFTAVAHSESGRWVAVGQGGAVAFSDDGRRWTQASISEPVPESLRAVAHSVSRGWVAVGDGIILVSADGQSWETRMGPGSTDVNFAGIEFGERGIAVAVGSRGAIFRSLNDSDWLPCGDAPDELLRAMSSDEQGFRVAVSDHGRLLTSADGSHWANATSTSAAALTGVARATARGWVAVGSHGTILFSENGREWTPVASPLRSANLTSVGYADGGLWVTVGNHGSILFSENGTEWHLATVRSPARHNLTAVAHSAAGRWVAVGAEATILVSDDGRVWSPASSVPFAAGDIRDILNLDEGLWVAVGTKKTLLFSATGRDWQQVQSLPQKSFDLLVITRIDGARLIAAGTRGIVLYSDNARSWNQASGDLPGGVVVHAVSRTARNEWIAGSVDVVRLSPGNAIPWVDDVRVDVASTPTTVTARLNGRSDQCPDGEVILTVLAQSDLNFRKFSEPLREIASSRIANRDGSPKLSTFKLSLADALGSRTGDAVSFAIDVQCGDKKSSYPRSEIVSTFVFRPWYVDVPWWLRIVAVIAAAAIATVLLYAANPLAVLRLWTASKRLGPIGEWVIPWSGVKVGDLVHALNLFLIPFLARRARALDRWVEKNMEEWRERAFEAEPTVARSTNYLPLPIRLGDHATGEVVPRPGAEVLRRLWQRGRPWVEISGSGGAGKTTLAIQLCRWTMDGGEGPSAPRRLPLLIDEDTSNVLATVVRKARAALSEEIDEDLIRALLTSGRLLVVFDRLSERSVPTFEAVERLQGSLRVAAALVTTRVAGHYEGGGVERVYPEALTSASLMFFLSTLLRDVGTGQTFSRLADQVDLATRLARMIRHGDRDVPLTPLLVWLFVSRAVELVESGRSLDQLPASVPEAYFEYLCMVNPDDSTSEHHLENERMLVAARALARLALGENYVPKDVPKERARGALRARGFTEAPDPIERLARNGVIVERSYGGRSLLSFALDPVAEYLAADDALEEAGDRVEDLDALLASVRAKGASAAGFLVALELTLSLRTAK